MCTSPLVGGGLLRRATTGRSRRPADAPPWLGGAEDDIEGEQTGRDQRCRSGAEAGGVADVAGRFGGRGRGGVQAGGDDEEGDYGQGGGDRELYHDPPVGDQAPARG